MKVKEESEKVGLKLNTQKTKIMAFGPITSWQIDGETVSDFILGGSKVTADGDCSHEIKRRLLLRRKVITNLDERVTGRKARGPQTEEIGCKCQTFLSLLSSRRKQTSDIFSFFIQI